MEQEEWYTKIEKYFALLYPDFDKLSTEQQFNLINDRSFIIKNTEAIDKTFLEFSDSDSPRYMEGASEEEIMKEAMWHVKVEKYFSLLHPDFDKLPEEKQFDLLNDKRFIINNTEAIHEAFCEYSSSDSPKYMEGASEKEMMEETMWHVKVEKYFALLYPDFNKLPEEKQFDLLNDKRFIIRNTEAIDKAFCEFSNSDSPRYMGSSSEQERMQKAIEEVKVKEKSNKTITPTTAFKSALKETTTVKSEEANGIEQSELNPEITKEGEELND